MTRKISCTIITFNEEDRISRCLHSIFDIADEIIVVDSGSTDKTIEICKTFGARCFYNKWIGYGQQKRFAEDLSRNQWILNLDADEWLTNEAHNEIKLILESDESNDIFGYKFKVKQVYPGASKPRLFADYHNYVRLYNKIHCRFPNSSVFDEIHINKKNIGYAHGFIFHQSIRSISHLVDKNIKYYKLQTKEVNKNIIWLKIRIIFEPILVFLKYYFLRRHVTGGAYGFIVSSTIAALRTYRLLILIKSNTKTK